MSSCRRPSRSPQEVAEIIARVRASGDDALRYYTRRFDTGGSTPSALRCPTAELATAARRASTTTCGPGLELAIANVTRRRASIAEARQNA